MLSIGDNVLYDGQAGVIIEINGDMVRLANADGTSSYAKNCNVMVIATANDVIELYRSRICNLAN